MANGKSLDKIALTVGKTKVSSKVENLADRMGYVYLSTLVGHFRASVHFSGSALTVRFHTQIAKLDTYGKLKLGSSSSFHVRSS